MTIPPPSSPWVTLYDRVMTGAIFAHQAAFWLPPGSTQSATSYTTSVATETVGVVICIRGEDSWTPEASSGAESAGNQTTHDLPSLTPS